MEVVAMTAQIKMSRLVKGLGQSVLSLSFNLGGILAGTLLALYLDLLSVTSWSLILFPGILSIRGATGGLFCGRLSTALHIGTVRASYTKNTKDFHLLFNAVVALTFGNSIMLAVTASLFGALFLGTTAADMLVILSVVVTTMGLSLAFISPISVGISVLSFKKGLDPDVTTYPVISTVADVLVTICYILVLNRFFSSQMERILIWLSDLIFLFIVSYLSVKNYREAEFVRTVKEFSLTFVLVTFIVIVTGAVLGKISQVIGDEPKMYVVYPALIDTVGDVGSIVGSTATTKLALGTIGSSFSSIKQHLTEIASAWSGSLIMFTLYAIIASYMHGLTASGDILRFMAQLLTTNILAVSLMVVISFTVAISTQKRGLDPDNFVIPIESSLADSITTISLLTTLTMAS